MTIQTPTPLLALKITLPHADDTDWLGTTLAQSLLSDATGGVIYLQGDLGAGKTALVRSLIKSCGFVGRIKSPSYTLLETYKISSLYFYHLDFYRFKDPQELEEAGFRDLFHDKAVVLIEWPEKAEGLLPQPDLIIKLIYKGEGRIANIDAFTQRGAKWTQQINRQRKA